MTVRNPSRSATLRTATGKTYPLQLLDASCTLSEAWAPYAQSSVTVAMPSLAVFALIDPYAGARVLLTVRSDTSSPARTFDLLVTARQRDVAGRRVGINLSSDEALVQDYQLVATAPSSWLWGYQDSVRSIVFNVLNRALGPGFTLSYDTPDAAFPTFSALTNFIPNGSFEQNVGGWTGGNAALSRITAWSAVGTAAMLVQPNTTSNDSYAQAPVKLSPGNTYTVSGTVRAILSQANTDARARSIWVYGTVDGRVVQLGRSPAGTNASGAVTRVRATFTVPVNTTDVFVRLYAGIASGSNQGVYWDAVMLVEGDGMETNNITPVAYFDGASATTAAYTYEWQDGPGSASTRTPRLDRSPDSLTWSPGQTAWNLLTPILQAAGMRLFCDEARTWHLVANDYLLPGVVHADVGFNQYSLDDLVSRTATQPDGLPLFADAVMIRYQWNDAQGRKRERYDMAGPASPQRPYLIERQDTAYPGPGAAAYVLTRLVARRRQFNVTAAEDLTVTPGQQVSITAGPNDTMTGYLNAVTWDLTTAEMSLTTKGLVQTPPTAYVLQPDSMTYATQPDAITYQTFTA